MQPCINPVLLQRGCERSRSGVVHPSVSFEIPHVTIDNNGHKYEYVIPVLSIQ